VRRKLLSAGLSLAFLSLSCWLGSQYGYQLGMQTPKEQLIADVTPQELARINTVIYGIGAVFLAITIMLTAYVAIALFMKAKRASRFHSVDQ
jgi:hypothetical protein